MRLHGITPLAHCAMTGNLGLVPMPTADATLLPPAFLSEHEDERRSARHLDDVGVEAVLGAMIEQKRRSSQPSFAAIDLPRAADDGVRSERAGSEPPRTATRSEVFLKAR
jgi:hypothetical protein